MESHTFTMVMIGLTCVILAITLATVIRRSFGRQAGEIGGWELRGAWSRIGAVARTTLAEGLRAKVASGFALLVLVSLPIFWLTAEGDGTVKGRVQMFSTYALGFSGFVLALLTIFFSCRSLSLEVASRQVYGVVTKPIPRWQILAGKWVGIMTLNVALLGIASVATYAGTRAIVREFREHLKHDLVVDGSLTPQQASSAISALDRVRGVGKKGAESPIVYSMGRALGLTQQAVVDMLLRLPEAARVDLRRFDELRRQVLVGRAAVRPELPDLTDDVEKRYRQLAAQERLPDTLSEGQIREHIETNLFGAYCMVVPGAPPRVWRLKGPVPDPGRDFIMSVRFKLQVGAQLVAGSSPRFGMLEKDTLLCYWGVGDPAEATFFEQIKPYAVRTFVEFEIPESCVEEDGTIQVAFANVDPRDVTAIIDLPSGLEVLHRVGSWELNVFQVFLAMLIPLACLASFGVCASTFLSFPVGSLIIITLYIITSSMGFVAESLAVTDEYVPVELQDLAFRMRRTTVDTIGWILSIGDSDPVSKLREGRIVGWPTLWENLWKFVLLKSGAVMFAGVLIFRRREVAAVIV